MYIFDCTTELIVILGATRGSTPKPAEFIQTAMLTVTHATVCGTLMK
jgi:hypothetical protein